MTSRLKRYANDTDGEDDLSSLGSPGGGGDSDAFSDDEYSDRPRPRKLPRPGMVDIRVHKLTKKREGIKKEEEVNEIDVVGDKIFTAIDEYMVSVEDNLIRKAADLFRKELEIRLIEQSDLLDEHSLLRTSLRRARIHKRQVRQDLLNMQKRREEVLQDLEASRRDFHQEERRRNQLEQAHSFLTDLEILRTSALNGDYSTDARFEKDGVDGLAASLIDRCGSGVDGIPENAGFLGELKHFNDLLEAFVKSL
ncbi:uncharacterized protein VTP21DRAFT_4483 [Calcarisporiella thermophila]|uniref:uncharacterized protein n=1 Tax=Calcarisporiella thermophila TaxID=911321 RepID=UPI0037441794